MTSNTAGEMYDDETGLYYLRARYYDPSVGRFISKDSVEGSITNPLSLNLYTYCVNNPIIYTDPSGCFGESASNWLFNFNANYIGGPLNTINETYITPTLEQTVCRPLSELTNKKAWQQAWRTGARKTPEERMKESA